MYSRGLTVELPKTDTHMREPDVSDIYTLWCFQPCNSKSPDLLPWKTNFSFCWRSLQE